MNSPTTTAGTPAESATLKALQALHSAEDFFDYLELPYDPAVLRVQRLHILKRMGQYLSTIEVTEDDAAVKAAARDTLARAYEDLIASGPLEQRLFKVLKEHDPNRPAVPANFVPLSSLFGSGS